MIGSVCSRSSIPTMQGDNVGNITTSIRAYGRVTNTSDEREREHVHYCQKYYKAVKIIIKIMKLTTYLLHAQSSSKIVIKCMQAMDYL